MFPSQDMTKADLYKRRYKNRQRDSSSEPSTSDNPTETDEPKEISLLETINNLKNRMNKNSIENDVELIKANTQDTPVNESTEPVYTDIDDIPSVKPVEKTYAKPKSKLDDYIYIESSKGLDGTQVAFPKTRRSKKSKESQSPVPAKRRKIETRQSKKETKETNSRELRSRNKGIVEKVKKTPKESIENEKLSKATRKRKHEEIEKPILREKGQNGRASKNSVESERKIVRAKKSKLTVKVEEENVRMTRSRRRRLEISLSPSEVKSVMPAFSFESDRRVNSIESSKSQKSIKVNNTKAKKNKVKTVKQVKTKANVKPVRSTRARTTRR